MRQFANPKENDDAIERHQRIAKLKNILSASFGRFTNEQWWLREAYTAFNDDDLEALIPRLAAEYRNDFHAIIDEYTFRNDPEARRDLGERLYSYWQDLVVDEDYWREMESGDVEGDWRTSDEYYLWSPLTDITEAMGHDAADLVQFADREELQEALSLHWEWESIDVENLQQNRDMFVSRPYGFHRNLNDRAILAELHRWAEAEYEEAREANEVTSEEFLKYARTGAPFEDRIIYEFDDGTFVVELDSVRELREETSYLRHCIGRSTLLGDPADLSHDWPEVFAEGLIRVFSMRPPGYSTMGKRRLRRAPFLTMAGTIVGDDLVLEAINGYDNRPPGFTAREGQKARTFNLREVQMILEWWIFGMHQHPARISARNWRPAYTKLILLLGRGPAPRLADDPNTFLQRVLELEPGAEGLRHFFEEGDWPRENASHCCKGEGFCAPLPWFASRNHAAGVALLQAGKELHHASVRKP